MNISTLCDKIELQPQIKKRVLSFTEDFDFGIVDNQQRGYFVYQNMNDALTKTQSILGDDADGIKILSCMLRASLEAYGVYQKKGFQMRYIFLL